MPRLAHGRLLWGWPVAARLADRGDVDHACRNRFREVGLQYTTLLCGVVDQVSASVDPTSYCEKESCRSSGHMRRRCGLAGSPV